MDVPEVRPHPPAREVEREQSPGRLLSRDHIRIEEAAVTVPDDLDVRVLTLLCVSGCEGPGIPTRMVFRMRSHHERAPALKRPQVDRSARVGEHGRAWVAIGMEHL